MKIKTMAAWMGLLALPCFLIDRLTKWLVYTHMEIGSGFTVVPGFFDIIHARNTGGAFGMLQGLPQAYRTLFFVVITVIACGAMFIIFWRTIGLMDAQGGLQPDYRGCLGKPYGQAYVQ